MDYTEIARNNKYVLTLETQKMELKTCWHRLYLLQLKGFIGKIILKNTNKQHILIMQGFNICKSVTVDNDQVFDLSRNNVTDPTMNVFREVCNENKAEVDTFNFSRLIHVTIESMENGLCDKYEIEAHGNVIDDEKNYQTITIEPCNMFHILSSKNLFPGGFS